MKPRLRILIALVLGTVIACTIAFLAAPEPRPPDLDIRFLGYTNRTGPFAIFTVQNRSEHAVSLYPGGIVEYARAPATENAVTSVEFTPMPAGMLLPQESLVQEFFVFPGTNHEWHLRLSARQTSTWLEKRRRVLDWLQKRFPGRHWRFEVDEWHRFTTEWEPCPP